MDPELNLSPEQPSFDSFDLFNDDPLFISPKDGQDCSVSDYDPDSKPSIGLLMFDDLFMSGVNARSPVTASVTHSYGDDPRSPSSNGGASSVSEYDRRSQASFVSSHQGMSPFLRFDLNGLRVESPYSFPMHIESSPQMWTRSPPLLIIPDLVQPKDESVTRPPGGDWVGPRLHIVPATPANGRAVGSGTSSGSGSTAYSMVPVQNTIRLPFSDQPDALGKHHRASTTSREPYLATGSPSSNPECPSKLCPDLEPGNSQLSLVNNMSRADEYKPESGHPSGGSCGATPGVVDAMSNVMTSATADADMKRRVVNSKFLCPVLGCGSTFTRHINLKGHLRTHNLVKCKWPGCGKGFARHKDCKRHERLHSNHRRFSCDGCRKPFARADGLNRLLRSERVSGCQSNNGSRAKLPLDHLLASI